MHSSMNALASLSLGTALLLSLFLFALHAEEEQKEENASWPLKEYGIERTEVEACIPKMREGWAKQAHEALAAKKDKDKIKLLFLGDSITYMWQFHPKFEGGHKVWPKYYKDRNAANFGISGDETEHVLWRITEGKTLEGASPKALVLLIGVNNLLRGDVAEDTAKGIETVIKVLRKKLPKTKILLLGVFPCKASPKDPMRAKVRETNAIISRLHDRKHIFYLDIGKSFLENDGSIIKEKLRDLLHLSEKGYEIWAEAMEPYLKDLLENNGKGKMWERKPAPPSPKKEPGAKQEETTGKTKR